MNHLIHACKAMSSLALKKLKKTSVEKLNVSKKKINRFDGLPEGEVQKCTLPDYLDTNLDIVFVGINPGLMAAHRGRYYAGPGNHFYKLLHESGLTSLCLKYEEDYKLLHYGIGLTNIVERATRSSSELKRTEIKEGSKIIKEKLEYYKPRIAVFNGKLIYEVFASKASNFNFGLQPEYIGNTALWVTPSSSARCAHFPRMTDKLQYYTALKKYLQFLKGQIKDINMQEFLFEGKCKQSIPSTSKMWRRKNLSTFLHGGRIANKDTICLDTSEENVAVVNSTEFIVKQTCSGKSYNINKISDSNESETQSEQNLQKVYVSQQNTVELYEKNVPSQIKCPDFKNDTNLIKSQHMKELTESKKIITKHKRNSNRRKKNSEKLQQSSLKMYFKNAANSEFLDLIKKRLQEKVNMETSEKKDAAT